MLPKDPTSYVVTHQDQDRHCYYFAHRLSALIDQNIKKPTFTTHRARPKARELVSLLSCDQNIGNTSAIYTFTLDSLGSRRQRQP